MAARHLSIIVIAPASAWSEAESAKFICWLPHFGSRLGVLASGARPPDFEVPAANELLARRVGAFHSTLNLETYCVYRADVFVEALADWGYFGPPNLRPGWLPANASRPS